jgi:hypothetical protein
MISLLVLFSPIGPVLAWFLTFVAFFLLLSRVLHWLCCHDRPPFSDL